MLLNKRGQSSLEYGVIIAIIVAALIAMQVYLKRGIQGRLKQASDDIGAQFSPGYTTGTYTTTTNVSSNEQISTINVNNAEMAETITNTTQNVDRSVNETTPEFNQEYWPR